MSEGTEYKMSAAVTLLLERMKTNPEEFACLVIDHEGEIAKTYGEIDKEHQKRVRTWALVINHLIPFMDDTEVEAVSKALKDANSERLYAMVAGTITGGGEEEKSEDDHTLSALTQAMISNKQWVFANTLNSKVFTATSSGTAGSLSGIAAGPTVLGGLGHYNPNSQDPMAKYDAMLEDASKSEPPGDKVISIACGTVAVLFISWLGWACLTDNLWLLS